MGYDTEKVDKAVLALLFLTLHNGRAWKVFDWAAMDRLHDRGLILDPRSKAKSVILTEDGERKAEEYFQELFDTAEK